MKLGTGMQILVAVGDSHNGNTVHCVCSEVAVGEHCTLWKSSGASGVKDCSKTIVALRRKFDWSGRYECFICNTAFWRIIAWTSPHQCVKRVHTLKKGAACIEIVVVNEEHLDL